MTRFGTAILVGLLASVSYAQDAVTYRDRSAKGERPIQTLKGKIDAESVAGIKIGAKTIPAGDVVDVLYESPGAIRLDLPKAVNAENARKYDEAIKEYRSLAGSSSIANQKAIKRHFEFKVAMLVAAKGDGGGDEAKAGVDALAKFIKDNADSWQRVHATRTLVRLHLDATPPDAEGARKLLDELAAIASPELKAECALLAIDTLLDVKQFDDAKKRLAGVPVSDPRVAAYEIVCNANPASPDAAVKQLNDLLERADDGLKPTIYNLLGDCFRLDVKHKKDALFSYLWVDVVYNQDPVELAKAQGRLGELFKDLKDESRAKQYRDKARGR